jgi:putative transposase
MAGQSRVTSPFTIIHSDHGSQFTSWAFTENVRRYGLLGSMGTTGDCYDCEHNRGVIRLTSDSCYDWPECLGIDLSASGGWRSTQTSTGRAGVTQ